MRIDLNKFESLYENLFLYKISIMSREQLIELIAKDYPELETIINSDEIVEIKIDQILNLKLDDSFDFVAVANGKILKESLREAVNQALFNKDVIEIAEFNFAVSVKSDLYKLVNNHILTYKNDLFLFEFLIKKYPDYLYTGIAYRFIHTSKYNSGSSIKGKSFSMNKEGIKFFTEVNSNFIKAVIVSHNIIGFNLVKFIHDYSSEIEELGFTAIINHFKQEQEIIAMEDLGLIDVKEVENRPELLDYLKNK